MDFKLTVLVLVALGLFIDNATADLFFNRPLPKQSELEALNLKCIPGRTVLRITAKKIKLEVVESDSDEYTRRGELRQSSYHGDDDERCSMCICSVDGKHEVCIKRPADSLNECIMMQQITKKAERGEPFEHMKSLSFRIRRDLLWHNDEIPYDPEANCYRGHSYYTNNDNPNETNINQAEEMTSLLDYDSPTTCYYCVCSVSGDGAGCIIRAPWFCNYFRYLRSETAERDMYATKFEQDRPTYFRQLSWRIRRSMDNSLFDLMEQGGDTLCCSHPDGHRRLLQNEVRTKLRNLKKRIPKENLLGGAMRGDYVDFIVNND